MIQYPKRLIEVDLPIKKISAHARREKSIRHGHISTLHIWWARRPLAACRAVICAALWPDPVDDLCPQAFRDAAAKILADFAEQVRNDATVAGLVSDHWSRWRRTNAATFQPADNFAMWPDMRAALLDFIADFANWDASTVPAFLNTARALTQAAHESLGGLPGTHPLVVDPFAGGGAIPLEALRVGADVFASDLNPVAVLLNKVVLEYIPKYGQRLADEVRKWGQWIKEQAEQKLVEFYPKGSDGATPIAYLWARTIISEAPDDGTGIPVEVPLIRSLWLAKKSGRRVALRWVRDPKGNVQTETVTVTYANGKTRTVRRPLLEIFEPKKANEVEGGTVAKGAATCPVTKYTTPVTSVRRQIRERNGGAADARLIVIVRTQVNQQGRLYHLPTNLDVEAVSRANDELARYEANHTGILSLVPDEPPPPDGTGSVGGGYRTRKYGIENFRDFFTPRQLLQHVVLRQQIITATIKMKSLEDTEFTQAVLVCLALAADKQIDRSTAFCRWINQNEAIGYTFGRQAIPMLWDFVETPAMYSSGGWEGIIEDFSETIFTQYMGEKHSSSGYTAQISATKQQLPNDASQCFFTDPPYYDSVPYAELSDFFYVWLKRILSDEKTLLVKEGLTPKDEECVVNLLENKDQAYFQSTMTNAMAEARRVVQSSGIGVVVFAHKSTSGWEAQLQAMIDAGWVVSGSWPIDTERPGRLRAQASAALASSIHLVCRPRKNIDGSLRTDSIGDWRDVLQGLPERIHAWLPQLAQEGVVGADAIFACLGPALEIYSRYSRVEKASGEQVSLKEYLEYVWAAVSKEALSMVFEGADASGFEEDARLTAMWLWTLRTDVDQGNGKEVVTSTGYTLEYDAARKIAQGLGAYLEKLNHLVEIKGSDARLLPVSARTRYLFGKEGVEAPRPARKSAQQLSLFETGGETEAGAGSGGWGELSTPGLGQTTLDRVHQSMLLFVAGRSEALRRFLVEEGVGQDTRYWALANALSALYPATTDEKRWVDGVLARKKGLGF